MAQVDRIVDVLISRQTQQIDIASFDIPLILVRVDESVINMPNRVETFTSLEAVGDMFGVNHNAYKMATKLLSGDLRPSEFKIGKVRYSTSPVPGVQTGVVEYTIPNPTAFTITSPPTNGEATVSETGEYVYVGDPGYNGNDSFIVKVDNDDSETENIVVNVTVESQVINESYEEALNAAMEADDEWYALVSDARFDQDILALAAIIQAQRRVYATSSSDVNITSPSSETDVGYLLKQQTMSRTFLLYSPVANTEFPEAAWVGREIVEVPGSNTWAFKRLEGVSVSKLTDTQINTLEDKNVNYYITIKGAPITQTGTMSSGVWIDEINENSLLAA